MAEWEILWRCECGNLNPDFLYRCPRCGKGRSEAEKEAVIRCKSCGNVMPWPSFGFPSTCPACGK